MLGLWWLLRRQLLLLLLKLLKPELLHHLRRDLGPRQTLSLGSSLLLMLLLLLFLDLGRWLVLELLSIDNTYPLLGSRKLTLVLQCLGRSTGTVSIVCPV